MEEDHRLATRGAHSVVVVHVSIIYWVEEKGGKTQGLLQH